MTAIHVRQALPGDQYILAEFNRKMAWETEQKLLDETILDQGVAAVFSDRNKGFYLVAEIDSEVVGQLMITREWSDWRNGWFWWIQSVYVQENHRRQGVFTALFNAVFRSAKEGGDIIGVRLYVERDNQRAQRTYESLGMCQTSYLLFEKSFLEISE